MDDGELTSLNFRGFDIDDVEAASVNPATNRQNSIGALRMIRTRVVLER